MGSKSVQVRVPATVGSFGGAVNRAAIALDASLNVKVTVRRDGRVGIRYFGEHGERVPRDRSNLVVRMLETALHFRELEFTGADFEIYSSVPVGVGLGSSTAAVWAGLIAADRLFRLELDEKVLFDLAAVYESRRDNLHAAWLGGFVASPDASVSYRQTPVPNNFVLTVVVPETSFEWGSAQGAFQNPRSNISGNDSTLHAERANALAELFSQPVSARTPKLDVTLPGRSEKDVPGLAEALQVQALGLHAVFVCGSGPAVGILTQDDPLQAVRAVQECFARQGVTSRALDLRPSNRGARDWNDAAAETAAARVDRGEVPARKISLIPV